MNEYELALNELYRKFIGREPVNTDTGRCIIADLAEHWDVAVLRADIEKLFNERPLLLATMKEQMRSGCYKEIYKDSATLLVYYMLKRKPKRLLADWPLSRQALMPYANDLCISLY